MSLLNDSLRRKKAALRKETTQLLSTLDPATIASLSVQICGHVISLPDWSRAQAVLLFMSMPTEIQTESLIRAAEGAGKDIYLPRVEGTDLVFHLWSGEELHQHIYGMFEPLPTAPEFTSRNSTRAAYESVLVICPGLAFDRDGNRLGRGKGFYDRFLKTLDRETARFVGICIEQQMVACVPAGTDDIRLDSVVTEAGIYTKE